MYLKIQRKAYLCYMKSSCDDIAGELAKYLREFGYSIYYKRSSPRSDELKKEQYLIIEDCEWMILMLDKHIFEDWEKRKDWIFREMQYAISLGKKILALKTPDYDENEAVPPEMHEMDFMKPENIIKIDTDNIKETAKCIRSTFEKNGAGGFEKVINRIYAGVDLWSIILFPLLGGLMMRSYLLDFYAMYKSRSNAVIGFVFESLGTEKTVIMNLFYIIAATLLCGIFMYITKKVIRLKIIPLIIADVGGVLLISTLIRKLTVLVFDTKGLNYWTEQMGSIVCFLSEKTVFYMLFIILAIKAVIIVVKRILKYT